MPSSRRLRAATLAELHALAQQRFPRGTAYSVALVQDTSLGGTQVTYRATAHPEGTAGQYRTGDRPAVGDFAGGPAGGSAGGGPAGGGGRAPTSSSRDVPPEAIDPLTVIIQQPDKVRELTEPEAMGAAAPAPAPGSAPAPVWHPRPVPPHVLTGSSERNVALALLQDGAGLAPTPEKPAAPQPALSTDDPHLQRLLDHVVRDGQRAQDQAPVATIVFTGLLDDAVEAAQACGHREWVAAGALSGGQPGAAVVCFGLGEGSEAARLASGLSVLGGDGGLRLHLAVDPSRKHADTADWVRAVAAVVEPECVVPVPRTVTSSPGTVRELGYRVVTPETRHG